MDKQKVLDKVAKCFALANSKGASPTEAETALRQARALMKQYNLESLEVAAHSINEASVVTGTKRAPQDWAQGLASICSKAFDGSYLAYIHEVKGWSFKFLGKGISPELAAHAYSALHHQLVAARQEHVALQKRCQLKTKRRRGQLFAAGWLNAVSHKVAEFAGTLDETTNREITAYLELHHPQLSVKDIEPLEAKGYDTGSLNAGWTQGQKVRLNRGVAQTRQATLLSGGGQ
ncbi:DUF2786 domain-containing protein [Pseudomonas gingeri]|uniref:DUF2786 domain-containing protein n=1 Tax=Pseudomonas gingeri TaxID=117681 RepID=A0A7Y7X809_9PSED|nr:DUF2786 domain-containing protein [Pseudomonas gingeri]NWB94897.1 DUF2786 domain-containing protein [Pseudomonas gingeri]